MCRSKSTLLCRSLPIWQKFDNWTGKHPNVRGLDFFFTEFLEFSTLISALQEGAQHMRNCSCVTSKLYEGNRVLTFDMKTLLNISGFQDGISQPLLDLAFPSQNPVWFCFPI